MPVSFELDADEQRIVDELGAFVDAEVLPLQEKLQDLAMHESRLITEDGNLHPDVLALSHDVRARSVKHGYYAMHLPEDDGGMGASRVLMHHAYKEVFRRAGIGLALSVLANVEGPNRMLLTLEDDLRREYFEPVVRGEKTTAFALTEPGAGSDVRGIATTARQEGDEWVLNGEKRFITNGPYADFVQVFAKMEGVDDQEQEGNPLGSITAFLVPKDAPGFRVGRTLETIANNGLPCELHFEDCRIPADHVIGAPGMGFFLAMDTINDLRVGLGGTCAGLAEYCIDRTVEYVNERHAFGKPVSKFQGVSFPLAESLVQARSTEMLALYTAWRLDQGEAAIQETSMTKLASTEMLWNVADRCIQAHGGTGVLRETTLERILRWARIMRVYDGTSEIQKQTIAKTMGL